MERKKLLAKKLAARKIIQSETETKQLKLFDFIYFNPKDNPMPTRANKIELSKSTTITGNKSTDDVAVDEENSNNVEIDLSLSNLQKEREEEENIDNENLESGGNEDSASSCDEDISLTVAPQLKLGADGQFVIDEESLALKTTAAKLDENIVIETIEETDDSYCYGKYNKKRKRSTDWTFKETAIFYKALSIVGTDFLLMESLLKWRTRKELKLKFKKEERLHKKLVTNALSDSTQFDFSVFKEFDYNPEEDRKISKIEDAKRKKDLIKEKKRKLHVNKINEKKEMARQNKERKQLLRSTFKPRRGLKCSHVQIIDEDSNDSRATSILVDPEEVIFEMTLLNKESDDSQMEENTFNDDLQEIPEDITMVDLPTIEPMNKHKFEKTVCAPSASTAMKETWFDVKAIRTDESNKNFVELRVDDAIKRVPVPAVQKDTSHVIVVATLNQTNDTLYHVYLASCSSQENATVLT